MYNEGFCRDCYYPLRGLKSNRCPECGRPFDPSDPNTFTLTTEHQPIPLLRAVAYIANGVVFPLSLCVVMSGLDTSSRELMRAAGVMVVLAGTALANILVIRATSSALLKRLRVVACGLDFGLILLGVYSWVAMHIRFGSVWPPADSFVLWAITISSLVAIYTRKMPRKSR